MNLNTKWMRYLLILLFVVFMSSCLTHVYDNISYNEQDLTGLWKQSGLASWYGPEFHGRPTASGEIFNMYDYTAAHRTLSFNSILLVVNDENNKSVKVRVTDRGPFVRGRVIDLSYAAAKKIGMLEKGIARVTIYLLKEGED